MAIIYSYPETLELLPADMLIGTSTIRVAGKKKNITKNFTLELLKNFILDGVTNVQWGTITGTLSNQTDLQAALNAKQNNITLTTTGSSGPATLVGATLNVPDYSTGITVPTLDQVLTAGNTSILAAKIGVLYGYDNVNSDYGTLEFYDSGIVIKAATTNHFLFYNDDSGTVQFSNGAYKPTLNFAGVGNNIYTFQNSNGTLAFTSDIPVAITSVSATSPITSSGGTTPIISTSMATNKLIGRSTAGTGVMEEITIGTGLSLSAGTLSVGSISGTIPHATATGTDTYLATIAGVAAYGDGEAYLIRFTNGNTTGCTLNINALGAVPLYRNNDGQLIGGDIWDGGEMLCTYNAPLNIFQCIGTSPNSLFSYITNADSVAITKGQPVYAFSGTGDRLTVKRAFNTSDAGSARTIGVVVTSSIAVNQKGIIIIEGLLDGLNILPTATWSDGDTVYLGPTAGSITNVKQYAPNHLVYLGTITTASNGSSGRWYVKVQNGYELDELHNVQAQSPSLKDTLWYDNTVTPAQWKTASIPTILGYTPFNLPSLTSGSVLFSNGTTIAQDNANFFWDDTNNRLGIGTASPTNAKLKVSGNSASGAIMSEDTTSTTSFVRVLGDISSQNLFNWQSGTALRFATSNQDYSSFTERMRITSTGNVGIGTTAPTAKLHIAAPGALSTDIALRVRNSADSADLMLVNGLGNVGIGTTTPATKLDVQNSAAAIATTLKVSNTSASGGNYLQLDRASNSRVNALNFSTAGVEDWSLGVLRNAGGATQIFSLSYQTGGNINATGFSVTTAGNVGIGTTAPLAKLDVYGLTDASNGLARFMGNSLTEPSFSIFGRISTVDLFVGSVGLANNLMIGTVQGDAVVRSSSGKLHLGVGYSNPSMTFISGGNIGVGTIAPVASAKLDITSTTQGFLPPRMTNAQRIAIATPAIGLMVYCTDAVEGIYVNKSTGWTYIG